MVDLSNYFNKPENFFVAEKEIERLKAKIAVTSKAIDPDQAKTPPLDQYFSCVICLHVVEKPRECSECNQLCCEYCIQNWLKRENTCPSCRKKFEATGKLNRYVLNNLNALVFNCD